MTVALLQCYMFSIGSILWRRIAHPETLPQGTFSLGRWGIPLNAFAFVWCAWSFVSHLILPTSTIKLMNLQFWSFWPIYDSAAPADFNWASVIFGAVILFSVVYYSIRGHKTYHGPVVLVKKM